MLTVLAGDFQLAFCLRHPQFHAAVWALLNLKIYQVLNSLRVQTDHHLIANLERRHTSESQLLEFRLGNRVFVDILFRKRISLLRKKRFRGFTVRSCFGRIDDNIFHPVPKPPLFPKVCS